MKTTNKKYYKRIDIPDMKRLELVLEDSAIAWKYQNNTVIISYDKPEKCIEAEKKKKLAEEQAKLLKLLGHKMAKFHLKVLVQRNSKGKITRTEFGDQHLVKD